MRTRTKLAIAAAIVSMMALGGVAQALTSPTLSMSAFHADGKIKAAGTYSPGNVAGCPAGGRMVIMLGGPAASGTTNGSGHYSISTAKLAHGSSYTVHTRVNGDMSGPYSENVICDDADSGSQTVTIP